MDHCGGWWKISEKLKNFENFRNFSQIHWQARSLLMVVDSEAWAVGGGVPSSDVYCTPHPPAWAVTAPEPPPSPFLDLEPSHASCRTTTGPAITKDSICVCMRTEVNVVNKCSVANIICVTL